MVRYDVRRSDATLDRDCSGSLASVEVTLTPYPFGSVLREHASVLLLAGFMLALGAFLVAVRPRSGAPGALLAAGCFYLFGLTVWPFGIQVVDLASGPRLWPFVIGDTANALFWGALLLMAASLPRQSLPPRKLVVGCFVVPLALHLLVHRRLRCNRPANSESWPDWLPSRSGRRTPYQSSWCSPWLSATGQWNSRRNGLLCDG